MMKNIDKIILSLTQRYNTASPFELCDCLGIIVIYEDLPDSVRGFFVKILKDFVIVINISADEDEARVVCAHELGHIMLHSDTNSISLSSRTCLCTSKYEREADLFAVNLLLEDKISSITGVYDNISAEELSCITHIPLRLIKLKFFPE